MKAKWFFIGCIGLIFFVSLSFSGKESDLWGGGSPAGYTGSPGDGKDCTACHGGSSSVVDGWITSDIPVEGYIPGQTYQITVTVSGSGDKGFQVAAQNHSGDNLGTLFSGTGSHLTGDYYVTHSSSSTANPKSWTFIWEAPQEGTGEVIFYGAFTVNKPVTKLSSLSVQENTSTWIESPEISRYRIFPNPVFDHIVVKGGEELSVLQKISLVSLNGEVIWGSDYAGIEEHNHTRTIAVPGELPGGIYLLRLDGTYGSETHKIMILPR